jgi:hypothetical protein
MGIDIFDFLLQLNCRFFPSLLLMLYGNPNPMQRILPLRQVLEAIAQQRYLFDKSNRLKEILKFESTHPLSVALIPHQ